MFLFIYILFLFLLFYLSFNLYNCTILKFSLLNLFQIWRPQARRLPCSLCHALCSLCHELFKYNNGHSFAWKILSGFTSHYVYCGCILFWCMTIVVLSLNLNGMVIPGIPVKHSNSCGRFNNTIPRPMPSISRSMDPSRPVGVQEHGHWSVEPFPEHSLDTPILADAVMPQLLDWFASSQVPWIRHGM